MAHPIYVCLQCKITMHTARNVGVHCKTKHDMDYIEAENKGIVVHIGNCEPKNTYLGKCPQPHNQPATDIELKIAQQKIASRR